MFGNEVLLQIVNGITKLVCLSVCCNAWSCDKEETFLNALSIIADGYFLSIKNCRKTVYTEEGLTPKRIFKNEKR